MAIAKLLPRKTPPSKTRVQAMMEQHGYDANPDKTREGFLVSSFMCQPETAAVEFETSKLLYETTTGRNQPRNRDVTMYRIIQSFKPGETTPEEANKIGYELAMKFTQGQHQFVVYTHEDRVHIHNHIEFNSINLECSGKFKNVKDSVKVLRDMNDEICTSHGLSTPEPKRKKALTDKEMGAEKNGSSFKKALRIAIDRAVEKVRAENGDFEQFLNYMRAEGYEVEKVRAENGDFEQFLNYMRAEGYEIKRRGKSLEFKAQGQLRFTRSFRLGEEYTEEALRGRIAGERYREGSRSNSTVGSTAKNNPSKNTAERKVNLLVDIQAKLRAGKGAGYEKWAKVFNLKEASKTLNFLTENGITDYETLAERAEAAGKKFDMLADRIKQLEARMAEVAQLKMHIINYSKTRKVYQEYKKAKNKAAFMAEHGEEIAKHEAAKAAFDALKGKPIPKVAELSAEYAALLAEKKACYEEYKVARQEMIDLQTAKHNVDAILGNVSPQQDKKKNTEL